LSTPELYLNTSFILDDRGRIVSTREPAPSCGPLFTLVRGRTGCAWAVREDLSNQVADEFDRLAAMECGFVNLTDAPRNAVKYFSLAVGLVARTPAGAVVDRGVAFTFPRESKRAEDIVVIEDERLLDFHFRGWVPGEIAAGRSPVVAIVKGGHPVSVCFCARRSDAAAEAGLETAEEFRGRGFGPRVTAAWAMAIRATGRIPLYSTELNNHASLSVARKLGLEAYASVWSVSQEFD